MPTPAAEPRDAWRHNGWMRQFLRSQAERQASMLGLLAARLERDLRDNPVGLPSKEWCRVARLYQDGYRNLAQQELEAAKVQLLARRVSGRAPLSDDEYEQQMAALGREAVRALSVDELEAELAAKRALPPGASVDE